MPIQYTLVDKNGVSILKFDKQVIHKKVFKGLNTQGAIFEDCIFEGADVNNQNLK